MKKPKIQKIKTTETKIEIGYLNIFGILCMLSWFLMIWLGEYRTQLFLTGLFAFILGLFAAEAKREKLEEKDKK